VTYKVSQLDTIYLGSSAISFTPSFSSMVFPVRPLCISPIYSTITMLLSAQPSWQGFLIQWAQAQGPRAPGDPQVTNM